VASARWRDRQMVLRWTAAGNPDRQVGSTGVVNSQRAGTVPYAGTPYSLVR
jgi:hypothetical protein